MAYREELLSAGTGFTGEEAALYHPSAELDDVSGSREFLQSLLNNIPGLVYRGMPDGTLAFVGAEVHRITGYSSWEILADPKIWRTLVHPEDIQSIVHSLRKATRRQERIFRMECRIVRKDGRVRWISDRRQLNYDTAGRLLFVDGFCQDITERKRAEEERRRLAAAVEYAADAVMITDAEWIIEYVNPAFEKVMGYSKEEVLGRSPRFLSVDDDFERTYLQIEQKVRLNIPWKGRLKNRRKDGALLVEDTVISPIRDNGGKVVHYIVAKRDITRQVLLEKQAQCSQRMEAVGTLAGGIAHDFNNALTGIMGFADLLRLRLEKEPKLQGDVDEILKCAERASTLTKQLLAFARRQMIEPVNLCLNTVVRDLDRLMRKVSGEHIEVQTRLTEEIPTVYADRGQLEQLLLNLCLNSRDAMPEGGKFLVTTETVSWQEERVEEQAPMPAGRYALLTAKDNGHGMDETTRKRAFEPYFTTKGPGKGTGLGLAMVYGIVKQNKGFVFIDSNPGAGTSVRIYFPAVDAVSEIGEEDRDEPVRGGTETILLAEDEDSVRILAERTLRGLGYEVLAAADGAEAVACCRNRPEIAIAVLDVVMPRMGGKDALEAIRRIRPDLPYLFTSGHSPDRIHESFVLLPGIEFLAKPYGPGSLARRVREVLDNGGGKAS